MVDKIINNSKAKNSKLIVENLKTEFVTLNDSVFLSKTNKILSYYDLEVDIIHY